MKVEKLQVDKFTAFENATIEFSPGINILIGANSTGKTHIMKLLYAILKTCERSHIEGVNAHSQVEHALTEKLLDIFKPADKKIGRLIRRKKGRSSGAVKLIYEETNFDITLTSQGTLGVNYSRLPNPESAVYIPPHEFLSIYEGFISAYTNRESSFDETYYDLSLALNALPLKGPRAEETKLLIEPLEKAIGKSTRITQENGRFYVKMPEGKLEAQLVSEGVRKLAEIIYLINNGALTKNGILFWDEPEANLNPRYIKAVVDLLQILSRAGMQIFIATHDYLLSQELSLLAEYPSDISLKFFAMYKKSARAGVSIESGNSLVDIDNNSILDEFAAHYDHEASLMQTHHPKA